MSDQTVQYNLLPHLKYCYCTVHTHDDVTAAAAASAAQCTAFPPYAIKEDLH